MKRFRLWFALIFMGTTGCATHYYTVDSNRVALYLRAPDAESVDLVASIDGFAQHPAERIGRGTWRVTLPADGEFRYFYFVDGKVYVPDCTFKENDDFGSENCICVPGL